MMATSFTPIQGPIIVPARATGPNQSSDLKLMLDTGATTSMIHLPVLVLLGFDPARDDRTVQITTASAVEVGFRVNLTRLFALGQNRIGFPVIAQTLPHFLQGHILTLDFREGTIALS